MFVLQTTQTGECGTIIEFVEVDRREWKKWQEENYAWFKEAFGIKQTKEKRNVEKKKKRQGREGTKLQQAIEMFRSFTGSREQFIELIEQQLQMSKQGATTYYYLVKKAV